MTFITFFGSLAVALAPAGMALIAVPGGKTKGIVAWFLAAAIVCSVAGPYLPAFGLLACGIGNFSACSIDEVTLPLRAFSDVFSLIT